MSDFFYVTQNSGRAPEGVCITRVGDGHAVTIAEIIAAPGCNLSSYDLAEKLRRLLNSEKTA